MHTFHPVAVRKLLDSKQPEQLTYIYGTEGHKSEVCLRRKSEWDKTFSLSVIDFCSFVRKFLALLITQKKYVLLLERSLLSWKTVELGRRKRNIILMGKGQ